MTEQSGSPAVKVVDYGPICILGGLYCENCLHRVYTETGIWAGGCECRARGMRLIKAEDIVNNPVYYTEFHEKRGFWPVGIQE